MSLLKIIEILIVSYFSVWVGNPDLQRAGDCDARHHEQQELRGQRGHRSPHPSGEMGHMQGCGSRLR